MKDQDNKSRLTQRIREEQGKGKRTQQEIRQTGTVKGAARSTSTLQPPTMQDFAIASPKLEKTAAEIILSTSGMNQAKQLIMARYLPEARESLRKLLYKDADNAEAWWVYAQIAENEDQLYHILSVLANLPTNPYTAVARARLTQLPYREPLKGGFFPTAPTERVGKFITQQLKTTTQQIKMTGERERVTRSAVDAQARPQIQVNRKVLIGVMIGIFAIVVIISSVIAIQQASSANAAALPIPTASVGDLLSYLIKVNLPISNLSTITMPNADWRAQQGVQFDVVNGNDKGSFIILSYASSDVEAGDYFKAVHTPKYKTWQIVEEVNVLLLASSDSSPAIVSAISSHFMHYLVAPYRPGYPTVTPTPASATP